MQRLSGLDASFLYLETSTQLLHVCGVVVLDVSTIPGGYSFAKLEAELAKRTRGIPALRRKLQDSRFNLDHPVWVDDTDFDINRHCHHVALPSPGGRDELARMCGDIAGIPLDRARPLWEMWVIEGLEDGSVAIMSKMHHAGVDGVTGSNMIAQLCGLTAEAAWSSPEEAVETKGAGQASTLDIALGGLLAVAARPAKLLEILPESLAVLPRWVDRARRGDAMPAPFTAPRTSLNGTLTSHRNMAFAQVDLAKVKKVKDAFGVKVNDVVLAMCSGALRHYLEDRRELPDRSLVAAVPVSVHGKSDRPGTNQVSVMLSELGTHMDDPAERLLEIAAGNSTSKGHNESLGASLLHDWSQFAGQAVFGTAMRLYSALGLAERHPVVHNLVISNVPGPPVPMYFLGALIKAMYPLGPIFHGAALNVTVMSLNGQLNVGLMSCPELAPHLWDLVDAFPRALEELLEAAEASLPGKPEASLPEKAETPA
ncbi:diacylglycerol O-acyltransferase [Rhodococcus sp. WMMA185]|uniref:WS/DGAT/MGAT family O-acyltransferase n=1 Tax=Rhodococcus sp. WMMA185 TaxID=679318 RepID=UPI0008785C83|nr:wax ester/triacylglycerol synthase family O-acyltransferase [Rhodococcus sp. WMMA185]AOW92483.1 diacylglycerol O-acyltransferase [Rhodococcus sp. WMMA185]